jgi:rubrerythrin
MYPTMIVAAKAEGNKAAEISFNYANEVEKIHSQLYKKVLEGLDKNQETFPVYVCPYCGNTVEHEAPGVCPVCGADGKLFSKVD